LEGTSEGERSPTIKLTIPAAVLERLRGEAAELGVKVTEVARVRLIASYEESPWPVKRDDARTVAGAPAPRTRTRAS